MKALIVCYVVIVAANVNSLEVPASARGTSDGSANDCSKAPSDCQTEFKNANDNKDFEPFYQRCKEVHDSSAFGKRCELCCKDQNTERIRGQFEVLPTGNHTSTLIWLHGIAETCAIWKPFLLALQSTSMKTICLEAPILNVTAEFDGHPAGAPIPAWFDIKSVDFPAALILPEDEEGIKASSAAIHEIIEDEISSGIKSSRIAVGGFSQGSAMSIYSTLTNKNDMGGLVALSGFFPLRNSLPGAAVEINKDVKALQVHGASDTFLPYDPVATLSNSLMGAFMTNLEFKVFEGLGHTVNEEETLYVKAFLNRILPTNP